MSKNFYRISFEKLDAVSSKAPIYELAEECLFLDKGWEQVAVLISEGNLSVSPHFELFHPESSFSPAAMPNEYRMHDEDEVVYILGMIDGWTESQLMEVYRQTVKNHAAFLNYEENSVLPIIKETISMIEFFRTASVNEEVIVVITDC